MESKGTASLLMVASLCFFHQSSRWSTRFVSPALLGLSIAFMGVGVFMVPYFTGWLLLRQSRLRTWKWPTGNELLDLGQFGLVAAVCGGIWFIPFIPDILLMVKARLAFGTAYVLFASPWRPVMALLPTHWMLVKQVFSLVFLGTVTIGFLRGQLSINLLTASIFIYFLIVSITDGSMDRVYMGLLMTMLLTVVEYRQSVYWLVWVCGVGGLLTLATGLAIWIMKQYFHRGYGLEFSMVDGFINVAFCMLFVKLIMQIAFKKHPPRTEPILAGD